MLHHLSRSVCVFKFSEIELIISASNADRLFPAKNNTGNQRSFFVGVHFFCHRSQTFYSTWDVYGIKVEMRRPKSGVSCPNPAVRAVTRTRLAESLSFLLVNRPHTQGECTREELVVVVPAETRGMSPSRALGMHGSVSFVFSRKPPHIQAIVMRQPSGKMARSMHLKIAESQKTLNLNMMTLVRKQDEL